LIPKQRAFVIGALTRDIQTNEKNKGKKWSQFEVGTLNASLAIASDVHQSHLTIFFLSF
jgi:hypothetical protein